MEKVIKKINDYNDGKATINKTELTNILLIFIGFFLGRVWIFGSFNPIIISYLSLFLFKKFRFNIIAFAGCFGIITSSVGQVSYLYIVSIGILVITNFFVKNIKSTLLKGIIGSTSLLVSCILLSLIYEFNVYYVIVTSLEGLLIFPLTIILKKGTNILEGKYEKKYLSGEEMISISILLGGIIAGASGIFIWRISIQDFLSSLIILLIGYKGGVVYGGLSGLILGVMLLFTGYANSDVAIILSIAGISSGILFNKNKLYTIGFYTIGRLLITIFLNKELLSIDLAISILLGNVAFLFIKDDLLKGFVNEFPNVLNNEVEYISMVKEITKDKLDDFSRAFHRLSLTFDSISDIKTSINKEDITNIIEEITSKVCDSCKLNDDCWKSNFLSTYQSVFKMMAAFEENGAVKVTDIPDSFLKKCVDLTTFVDITTRVFEIHKLNLIWENKISENRELVSLQLLGVSEIINSLSKKINNEIVFKRELEDKLLKEFNLNKISVNNLLVMENSQERYEIYIYLNTYIDKKTCENIFLPIINKVTNRKMRNDSSHSTDVKLKFIEEARFKVSSSVAKTIKDNSDASGDSYSYLEMDTGEILLALSDGMGSGYEAMMESNATIDLLEEFIEAGFKKELAINIINSALVLKSNDESFSTLDICTIDIYKGNAEFIKIGASSTFLLRNGKVQVIKSTSLPMGILNKVDLEVTLRKLVDEDIIIMVTDGVLELFDDSFYKEEWIINYLEGINNYNPESIARNLLNEAKKRSEDIIKDDMTILVGKIWEGI